MNEAGIGNYNKGIAFLNGDGVKKDETKALHYLKIAAEKGNTFANFEIARSVFLDKFPEVDRDKAINYAKAASDDGHTLSMLMLALFYKEELSWVEFGGEIKNPEITAENIINYLQQHAYKYNIPVFTSFDECNKYILNKNLNIS